MPDFPDYCIRGIKKESEINKETDTASAALFLPNTKKEALRADGSMEVSINWEDEVSVDEVGVLDFTLQYPDDKNPTTLAFPHGAVKLSRSALDDVNGHPATPNTISYERQEIVGKNPYHGNIIYRTGLPSPTRTMIANVLAWNSSPIHRRNK